MVLDILLTPKAWQEFKNRFSVYLQNILVNDGATNKLLLKYVQSI